MTRHALRGWVMPAVSASVLAAGCAISQLQRAQRADELRDYDLAVVHYTKAVQADPASRDAALGLERARLRGSDAHLVAGRRLYYQGRYDEAARELQVAVDLNPSNAQAEDELRHVRSALRAKLATPPGSPSTLESVIARARTLAPAGYDVPDVKLTTEIRSGTQMTGRQLYLTLASLAKISVTFDTTFRDAPAQAVLLSSLTLRQALDAAARATNTFYQATGPATITVVPDTPQKRREYMEEAIGQIVVQNADLKETADALRVVGDMRSLSVNTGTNTILIRDTPDRIQAAQRFVAAFDKARPEVVVDVEVFEVNRARVRDYGLQLATPGSVGVAGSIGVPDETLDLSRLRSLGSADVLTSSLPALYYRLLKTDDRTRTLANPSIRILDGVTGVAKFGEDVPVPRTVITPITQGGVAIQPQTQFDYRTVGVNISITPRTHANSDVTMALSIELSNLAGTGYDGLPTFGSRSVSTTIRLKDGQTNILAGLIRDDERAARSTVPGLGDVPGLGKLFARNQKDARQTDVVIMLTPHIVRELALTENDLRPFKLPREGIGGAAIIEGPIVPPPPIRGGGGGPGPRPPLPAPPPIVRREH
jgi:general secretion pathway protein D